MEPTDEGYITPEILENYITDRTRLVSVMFANNEIGSIQPIQELCKTAHAHGALFHTDAVQAVGHVKINVHELEVDFLSASAHKFNGPKGIGFLYVRKGIELLPYADGGAQESAHRAGTENVASIVGMATALKENCDFSETASTTHLRIREYLDCGAEQCRNFILSQWWGNHAAWPNKSVIFGEGRRSNSPPYGSYGDQHFNRVGLR